MDKDLWIKIGIRISGDYRGFDKRRQGI